MSSAPHAFVSTAECGCALPGPQTPVPLHRKLLPGLDLATLDVFGDERWDLMPGVFESHVKALRLNFTGISSPLREATKHYFWQLINHEPRRWLRRDRVNRLSLQSVVFSFHHLHKFLIWLDVHAVSSFDKATTAQLDQFLDDVRDSEDSNRLKQDVLRGVRRLWSYRDQMPAAMRLPLEQPWNGDDPSELVGPRRSNRENATHRIHPDTLQPLLMWSLRFVECFAGDITAAFVEYQRLMSRGSNSHSRPPAEQRSPKGRGWFIPALEEWLADLRRRGAALPGRVLDDGAREVDWGYISRIFDCATARLAPGCQARDLVLNSGLPIAQQAHIDTPITGSADGRLWRDEPIAYLEAPRLARLLSTASAVVTTYLSGMRAGEVLSLERDCITYDPVTRLWLVRGHQWKGAVNPAGDKLPEGQQRRDPWTVIEPVATAINVAQQLHPHSLLFPSQLRAHGITRGFKSPTRLIKDRAIGRSHQSASNDLADLIACWVNAYCTEHGRDDERIPADPKGAINLSRFRRTLAWHIVRRPRGLIAGAIQYGHLQVRITLGYAGSYDSGFPDDHAYEDWLFRLEQIADRDERLANGEQVSGPAADTYRHRVGTAHEKFAGRVLTSNRQARDLLDNPLLQLFPGRAMTCVFDASKALCQIQRAEGSVRQTPDRSDCRPQCKNIAYTDQDIAELLARTRQLRELTSDRLAPSIRRARDQHELDRITQIIRRHGR